MREKKIIQMMQFTRLQLKVIQCFLQLTKKVKKCTIKIIFVEVKIGKLNFFQALKQQKIT